MAAASVLLGAVLTFGASDGKTLQLTLSTTEASTVALAWGDVVRSSTTARVRHVFRGLPTPEAAPLEYVLSVGREAPRRVTVKPIRPDALRFAVYGDSRDGSAPHAVLVKAMEEAAPDLVVHTGDVIHSVDDDAGWVSHLAATLPLTAKAPLILSLGNHELQYSAMLHVDGLARALDQVPPPDDPIARELQVPKSAFHVRVGPALFVSLDSNQTLRAGSPQHEFLDRVLREKGDARWTFVSYHHGPYSSGRHGGHADAADVVALLERHGVTASFAGHDHTYERIVSNGITYLVAGGGGAPLYQLRDRVPGSQAFASTYSWALVTTDSARVDLEAYSLEKVLIDKASIAPPPKVEVKAAPKKPGYGLAAAVILIVALGYASVSIIRRRSL